MWNNAGSFLAPRQARHPAFPPTGSSDSSSEAEDLDISLTVTTPVQTPCVLGIARRDPLFGVAKSVVVEPSFFAERDVQAPRCVHEVNLAKINCTTYVVHTHIIVVYIFFA